MGENSTQVEVDLFSIECRKILSFLRMIEWQCCCDGVLRAETYQSICLYNFHGAKIWSHRVKESLKAVQFSVALSGSQQAYDKTLFIIAHIISGKVISNQVG